MTKFPVLVYWWLRHSLKYSGGRRRDAGARVGAKHGMSRPMENTGFRGLWKHENMDKKQTAGDKHIELAHFFIKIWRFVCTLYAFSKVTVEI